MFCNINLKKNFIVYFYIYQEFPFHLIIMTFIKNIYLHFTIKLIKISKSPPNSIKNVSIKCRVNYETDDISSKSIFIVSQRVLSFQICRKMERNESLLFSKDLEVFIHTNSLTRFHPNNFSSTWKYILFQKIVIWNILWGGKSGITFFWCKTY